MFKIVQLGGFYYGMLRANVSYYGHSREKENHLYLQLEALMYCSTSTLRRDLIKLEKEGKIIRSHGEVRLVTTNNIEYAYDSRSHEETQGKTTKLQKRPPLS